MSDQRGSHAQRVDVVETDLEFGDLQERWTTDLVVVHHTGSDVDASAEQIHGWHLANGWAGIGYHYVVRRDGTIERGRPEWAIGSHAYGENSHSVGVHLSGDFDQTVPTQAQVERTAMLIADVCGRYGLAVDRDHVVGHGELMATSCPGRHLQALLDDGVLTGKAVWYAQRWADVPQDDHGGQDGSGDAGDGGPEGGSGPTSPGESGGAGDVLDSVPEWARPTVDKLVAKGLLKDPRCSLDVYRVLVVNDRAGLYD